MPRRRVKSLPSPYPESRPYHSPSGGRRTRPIPDRIERYYLPLSVIEATDRVMRRFGKEKRECYVWWAGYFSAADEGQIVTALCPEIRTEYGHIRLGTAELTLLHSRLRELDQVLLAELHTHPPGAGGQNEVDASHSAATYPGFISIVVPDFALPRLYDLRESYVYEYLGSGEWHGLGREEIRDRFIVEESFISVGV
jgi:hypothetical protein